MTKNDLPIIPLRDKILMKKIENEERVTSSGIFIPVTAQDETYNLCEVLAVGDGEIYGNDEISSYIVNYAGNVKTIRKLNIPLLPGDIVITEKIGAKVINKNNEKYVLISYSDVWGIYERKGEYGPKH